jgi:hypothetical protein
MTLRRKSCASEITVETMAMSWAARVMLTTNERSILSASTGSRAM